MGRPLDEGENRTGDLDLFGNPVPPARRGTRPGGYAAPPGTGPAGETCGTCLYLYRNRQARVYLKCRLMRRYWTGGPGSDVRAGSPACREWEGREGK